MEDSGLAKGDSFRWPVWHWVSALALLLALSGVAMFLWSGPDEVLDRGDKLFSVVSGLVAVVSLVASAVTFRAASRAARWSEADPTVLQKRAAKDLATWVQRQWRREATARWLDRPEPLGVRWSSTSRPVAPAPGEVLGATGPQGRVLRLRLGGDVNDVVSMFLRLPHRQLVVLGQPGAGKSVLMLLLTLGLLRRWRSGQPVPVLLNLSSWNPNREHLDTWLARRLVEEYPALGNRDRYGPGMAMRLVSSEAVLPVLDGLDEMPQARHAVAVVELNNAVGGGRAVVVACRAEEYQAAVAAIGATLGRAAVVELEPVDADAAAVYLPAGQPTGQQRWAPVIAHLRTDPFGPLARALSTPLMVHLARTVYSAPDRDPAELCDPRRWATPQQIEDHLLDAYLPALYPRGSAQPMVEETTSPALRTYPADQARHWLAYLAAQMTTLGTRDLAWWQLPRMVSHFELVFGLAVRLMAGLGFGLAFGLTYGFTFGPARGLTYGLIYGLAFGLGLTAGLRFTDRVTAGLAAGSTAGFIAAIGIGLALGFEEGLAAGFEEGLAAGIEAGFVAGISVGLITRCDSYRDSRPRQIELSAPRLLQAMARSLPLGLMAGLGLGLVLVLIDGNIILLASGLVLGLAVMLGFGVSEAIVMAADDQNSTTPRSLLRGERGATIAQVVAFGLAASLADLLTTWLAHGLQAGLALGLAASLLFGLTFGLAAGLATGIHSPWLRFLATQGWLAARGQLPWNLMQFLEDAHRRGVLRQVGALYQFRHARLQDRLASIELDPAVTRVGGGISDTTDVPVLPVRDRKGMWRAVRC